MSCAAPNHATWNRRNYLTPGRQHASVRDE